MNKRPATEDLSIEFDSNKKKVQEVEENKSEILKIHAKTVKSGELKGLVYFIDDETETSFIINSKNRTSSGKIVDGKKVELNDDDKKRLVNYDITSE